MKGIISIFIFTLTFHLNAATCESQTTPELRTFLKEFYKVKRGDFKDSIEITKKLSKLTAMIMKESSGNTCSVSDMSGNGSYNSYTKFFKKNNSKGILSRSHKVDLNLCQDLLNQGDVKVTKQTNYGLAQISADRYVMSDRGGDHLRGFFVLLKKMNTDHIISYCQSKHLFSDDKTEIKKKFESIKNCTPGISNKEQIKCIGQWVTLCPSLNVELAINQPMSYFETKSAKPICEDLFKKAEVEYLASRVREVKDQTKKLVNPPKKDCCEDQ